MKKDINVQLDNILRRLDSQTYNHSVRVMMLASEIEKYLDLPDHRLMTAALFHDIGKLYIPFNILDKSNRLSSLERELIDLHPYIGYKMLSELGVNEDVCRIVLYHHSFKPITISDVGYYDKEDIYENAVILHTVDSFEALTTDRPYHRGLPTKDALQIMEREGNYNKKALEYIMSASSEEDESSAVNRSSHSPRDLSLTNIIMEMELVR